MAYKTLNELTRIIRSFDELKAQLALGTIDKNDIKKFVESRRVPADLLRQIYAHRARWVNRPGELESHLIQNKKLPADLVQKIWDTSDELYYWQLRYLVQHPNLDKKIIEELIIKVETATDTDTRIIHQGEYLLANSSLTYEQYERLVLGPWDSIRNKAIDLKRTSTDLLKKIFRLKDLKKHTGKKILMKLYEQGELEIK